MAEICTCHFEFLQKFTLDKSDVVAQEKALLS